MSAGKRQSTLRTFGKVSKASAFPAFVKPTKQALVPSNTLCHHSKRKRDESDNDEPIEFEVDDSAFDKVFTKKPKIRYPTPPPFQPSTTVAQSPSSAIKKLSLATPEPLRTQRANTPEDLPEPLKEIIAIHANILKALSIHFAHSGPSAPAEVSALCKTITSLWKRRGVTKNDLQRVLAICELTENDHAAISPTNTIEHDKSHFRLTTASVNTCLEYVAAKIYRGGMNRSPFNEKCLQSLFRTNVMALYITANRSAHLKFLNGPLSGFPLLVCDVGAQTKQRIAKASAARSEILNVAKASQSRQNAKPVVKAEEAAEERSAQQASQQLKSRTLSLFERVKAKQLANAANGAPTPESILRQHATGRIGEVVEILRMKQQQKQHTGLRSAIDESPSKVRVNKVAFGFAQIIQEIKNSVSIPIQDDEAKKCLQLLNEDVEGTWLTTFELGSVKSIVLQGEAKSGGEIQRELEAKEKARKS